MKILASRKNLYSGKEQAAAIGYRIVNENFPKLFAKVRLFQRLNNNFPEIIADTEKSLSSF